MLEAQSIIDLKNRYGNIYSVNVKGNTVIFRELTFKEYTNILNLKDIDDSSSADIEDLILQYSIVHPSDFNLDTLPPGNISTLANDILDISGLTSAKLAKKTLEEKRSQASEVKNLMKAFVLATISSYSPEDLENMTFSQLAERVALAEKIIEIKQNINGIESTNLKIELIDPEEEAEKEKIRAARHNASKLPGEAQYEDPIAKKLWGG